jgi:hypothetical protein
LPQCAASSHVSVFHGLLFARSHFSRVARFPAHRAKHREVRGIREILFSEDVRHDDIEREASEQGRIVGIDTPAFDLALDHVDTARGVEGLRG